MSDIRLGGMKYLFYCALIMSCLDYIPVSALDLQQKSCWSRVTGWVPKKLHPNLALTTCAGIMQVAVLNSFGGKLLLWSCGATGLALGGMDISQEQFNVLFPRAVAGTVGALVGTYVGPYLATGENVSDIERLLFSGALCAGSMQMCWLWQYCRAKKSTATVNQSNAAVLV